MSEYSTTITIVALLLLCFLQASSVCGASEGRGGIAVYWGQNGTQYEGSIQDACNTANYNYSYINIAFLNVFGGGRTPSIDLTGHCDPQRGGCTYLGSEIQGCQSRGIKVFLSLGGGAGDYSLASPTDAQNLADYLWNTFLGGTSPDPLKLPFGGAVLDGIDLAIVSGSNLYYDDLVRHLKSYEDGSVYLSAAPGCLYPDPYMGDAISTGLFDYVWVQFYNNSRCEYVEGDTFNLLLSWTFWNFEVQSGLLFMGLPASPSAATSGYIEPQVVRSDILPRIKQFQKYGGVMVWNRYWDDHTGFSPAILPSVFAVQSSNPSLSAII